MSNLVQWRWKWIIIGVLLGVIFIFLTISLSFAQPTSSTISPKAFGSRSWRENGIAPQSLPLTNNLLWDVRLASDGQLYYWNGTEWVSITSSGGEISHNHQADVVDIFDDGGYFVGATVELALQETGSSLAGVSLDISTLQTSVDSIVADPRWIDARTPLSHIHSTSDITSGTFADARISSSSITQHESALESVMDLQDLQGAVIDSQVPDTITKTGTPLRCARFDTSGVLVPASGDCISGDTGGSAVPGGSDTQVQINDAGVFNGDAGLTYNKTTDVLTVSGPVRAGAGTGASNLGIRIGSSSGFWEVSPGDLLLSANGANIAEFNYSGSISSFFQFMRGGGSSWWLNPISAGATVVSLGPRADDTDTGLGGDGANSLSLIVGGVEGTRVTSTRTSIRQSRDIPQASPLETCGGPDTLGLEYTDTSVAKCWCDGTSWIKIAGGGSCS